MCDQPQGLTGPEFLDSVADAEASNGLDINAAAYRSNADIWRRDRKRIEELESENASFQRAFNRARAALPA